MLMQYLAHSSFHFTPTEGPTVLTDPYGPDIGYGSTLKEATYCLVSHDHPDHNHLASVNGRTTVVRSAGVTRGDGVTFKGILASHGPRTEGPGAGTLVFTFALDGVRLCHLGDLGAPLDPLQIAEIGEVDVLFVPVGGTFTLDGRAAWTIVEQLRPRLVIPMHYGCAGLRRDLYPLDGVEAFTRGRKNVTVHRDFRREITKEALPPSTQVLVMGSTH